MRAMAPSLSFEYELAGIGIGAPNANYHKGTIENPANLWKFRPDEPDPDESRRIFPLAAGRGENGGDGREVGRGSSPDWLHTGRRICIRCNYRLQRSRDRARSLPHEKKVNRPAGIQRACRWCPGQDSNLHTITSTST